MTPTAIPIFLNGNRLAISAGESLGAVLARSDVDLLALLMADQAQAVDGRGIAVNPDQPLSAGAILRVFPSARRPDTTDA